MGWLATCFGWTGMPNGNYQEPRTDVASGQMKGIEDYARQLAQLILMCRRPRQLLHRVGVGFVRRWQLLLGYFASFRDERLKTVPGYLVAWATFSRMVVISVALIIPAWLLEVVDPFGLSGAVERHSQKIVQKIAAPFYPATAQSRIAVVLIDEGALAVRGESWPPRYLYYEEVVRRIAKQRPSAIFLDVLVEDRRSYDTSLPLAQKALEETLKETGVPLYLAVLDGGERNLFAKVPGTHLAMAGWSGHGADYPLLVDGPHRFGAMPSVSDNRCGTDSLPTAAFALYRQLCERGENKSCGEALAKIDIGAFCAPMVVQWGYNVAPQVRARDLLAASQCAPSEVSPGTRLFDSARILWSSLLASFDKESEAQGRQTCPYTLTVREEDLSSARVRGLLKDRVVLVGTSLAGIHDLVASPVHGQLPGVYLHAMALDNLLTWDDHYFARAEGTPTLLVLGLLLAWVSAALIRANPARLDFLLHAFAAVLVLGVSAFFYLVLHRPPLDWLGLLLIFELARRILEASANRRQPSVN